MLKNNKRMILLYSVISVVIIFVPVLFLKVKYIANDDYQINNIANGSLMSNTMFLVYPSIIFGAALRILYTILPGVNWMIIVFMLILSLSIFELFVLLSKKNNLLLMIITAAMGLCLPFFMTYTAVAYIAVGTGCVLMMDNAYSKQNKKSIYFISILMVMIGYTVRSDTLVSGMVLFTPFALMMLCSLHTSKKNLVLAIFGAALIFASMYVGTNVYFVKPVYIWILLCVAVLVGCVIGVGSGIYKQLFIVFSIIAISVIAVNLIDRTYEAIMGYDSFRAWTIARSNAIDRPLIEYEHIKGQLGQIGISESEYNLFTKWIFADKKVFSTDVLNEMSKICDQANVLINKQYIIKRLKDMDPMLCVVLPLITSVAICLKQRGKRRIFIALSAVILELLYVVLFLRQRFVARVYMPLLCISIMEMLVLFDKNSVKNGRLGKFMYIAVIAACIAIPGRQYLRNIMHSDTHVKKTDMRNIVVDYIKENSDKHYIIHTMSEFFGASRPAIDVKTNPDYSVLIMSGSWDSFSPRYYDQMNRLEIDEPDRLLCVLGERDDFRFVYDAEMFKDDTLMADLEKYLEEQIGVDFEPKMEKRFESGVEIYKFLRKSEESY